LQAGLEFVNSRSRVRIPSPAPETFNKAVLNLFEPGQRRTALSTSRVRDSPKDVSHRTHLEAARVRAADTVRPPLLATARRSGRTSRVGTSRPCSATVPERRSVATAQRLAGQRPATESAGGVDVTDSSSSAARGRAMVKAVPPPSRGSAQIRPFMAATRR